MSLVVKGRLLNLPESLGLDPRQCSSFCLHTKRVVEKAGGGPFVQATNDPLNRNRLAPLATRAPFQAPKMVPGAPRAGARAGGAFRSRPPVARFLSVLKGGTIFGGDRGNGINHFTVELRTWTT